MAGVVAPWSDPESVVLDTVVGPWSDPKSVDTEAATSVVSPWSDPKSIDTTVEPYTRNPWSDPASVDTTRIISNLEWFVWDGVSLREVDPLGVWVS